MIETTKLIKNQNIFIKIQSKYNIIFKKSWTSLLKLSGWVLKLTGRFRGRRNSENYCSKSSLGRLCERTSLRVWSTSLMDFGSIRVKRRRRRLNDSEFRLYIVYVMAVENVYRWVGTWKSEIRFEINRLNLNVLKCHEGRCRLRVGVYEMNSEEV